MLKRKRLGKFVYVLSLFLLITPFVFSSSKIISNSLESMNRCEGKIKLSLVRIWGGDDEEDDKKFFKSPIALVKNRQNQVFLLDNKLTIIRVFDAEGNYLRTMGRKGQGPGEFNYPTAMVLDRENNILVNDLLSRKLHRFDATGKILDTLGTGFSISQIAALPGGKIAAVTRMRKDYHNCYLVLLDPKGKFLKELVKFNFKIKPGAWETVTFTIHETGSYMVAYKGTPLIRKYSNTGAHTMDIHYKVPFPVFHRIQPLPGNRDIEVVAEKTEILVHGISRDDRGHTFLVSKNRPLTKAEKKLYQTTMIRNPGGGTQIIENKNKMDPNRTDLFRLVVFDRAGKIIASKKLDVYCDNIATFEDRLYVIDSKVGARIYEYRFQIK